MKWSSLLLFLTCTSAAWACSGPHTQEDMIYAMAFGKITFALQAILGVFTYRWYRTVRAMPGHPLLTMILLAVHPNWYMGVEHGDCGMGLEMLSLGMIGLALGLAIWQFEIMKKTLAKGS